MPVVIPDEVLKEAGLSEREALIEIACRLFDLEKLDLWPAAKLAGLSRVEMEDELMKRRIPIYRPTVEDLMEDLKAIEHLEEVYGRSRK
jgi:predicted HTH domain antitoxin